MSGTPIKSGDLCEVIDGLLGKDSPNLGLIVRVKHNGPVEPAQKGSARTGG